MKSMEHYSRSFFEKSGLVGLGLTGMGFLGDNVLPKPVKEGTATTVSNGDLRLLDWEPVPQLIVKETEVLKPKYTVIDFHNNLRNMNKHENYLIVMDTIEVWIVMYLDGT